RPAVMRVPILYCGETAEAGGFGDGGTSRMTAITTYDPSSIGVQVKLFPGAKSRASKAVPPINWTMKRYSRGTVSVAVAVQVTVVPTGCPEGKSEVICAPVTPAALLVPPLFTLAASAAKPGPKIVTTTKTRANIRLS